MDRVGYFARNGPRFEIAMIWSLRYRAYSKPDLERLCPNVENWRQDQDILSGTQDGIIISCANVLEELKKKQLGNHRERLVFA